MNDKLTTKEKIEIAIQSGLELIPYVGGALSSVYFATKQEKRFKRLEASSGGKTPPLTTVPGSTRIMSNFTERKKYVALRGFFHIMTIIGY